MRTLEDYLENLEKETKVTVFKSSGPGGQHKNKTETAVRLQHLPTGLTATAVESRSQMQNRKVARERLVVKLEKNYQQQKPRVATAVPKRAKEKRLQMKKKRSELKKQRKKPGQIDQAFFILNSNCSVYSFVSPELIQEENVPESAWQYLKCSVAA